MVDFGLIKLRMIRSWEDIVSSKEDVVQPFRKLSQLGLWSFFSGRFWYFPNLRKFLKDRIPKHRSLSLLGDIRVAFQLIKLRTFRNLEEWVEMMRNIVWFNLFRDKWIDQVRLKTLIIVMWLLSKMENIHFESHIPKRDSHETVPTID